jgi:hypothetical protein
LYELNAHAVEYLVVGAHALAAHGQVRATKDLDIWIRPDKANSRRVIEALREFGAPLQDLTEKDLTEPGLIVQIGVAPVRIDLLTAIDGVDFAEAWPDRVSARFADQEVHVLSRAHLIKNKQASGRKQDLADLEWLDRHPPEESSR